jgi:hypothetical protein
MVTSVELTYSWYVCYIYCMYLKLLSAFIYITNIRQYKRLMGNAICDYEKCQGCAVVLLECVGPVQNLPLQHVAPIEVRRL